MMDLEILEPAFIVTMGWIDRFVDSKITRLDYRFSILFYWIMYEARMIALTRAVGTPNFISSDDKVPIAAIILHAS